MKDPYTILGVARNAEQSDIKKSYHRLAKALHPDSHPDDAQAAERFKEVSAAYSILGDPDTRKQFDTGQINAAGQQRTTAGDYWEAQARGESGDQGGFQSFEFGNGMDDLFSDLFGGFRRTQQKRRRPRETGASIKLSTTVSFIEAALGATKRLTLPDGRKLNVRIPAGIEDGQQIRLKNQGDPSQAGGMPGDVLIDVAVQTHMLYSRKGLDIHVELPVTLQEAVLGAVINVPTIHGDVSLRVPKRSNTGSVLRLRTKGIQGKDGQTGDQYVKLKIMLPEKIDDELESLIEGWARKHDYNVRKPVVG
jgi:DnaJ-class molecular chaperone